MKENERIIWDSFAGILVGMSLKIITGRGSERVPEEKSE